MDPRHPGDLAAWAQRVAAWEQAGGFARDLARLAAAVYHGLVAEGVPAADAAHIAGAYLAALARPAPPPDPDA